MGSTTAKVWVILEAKLWWVQEYSSESQFTFQIPPCTRASPFLTFLFGNLNMQTCIFGNWTENFY